MSYKEKNKLIAEFMGLDINVVEDFKYNSSWDLLMPVIEKIGYVIGSVKYNEIFSNGVEIEEVYKYVVAFVECFNEL